MGYRGRKVGLETGIATFPHFITVTIAHLTNRSVNVPLGWRELHRYY